MREQRFNYLELFGEREKRGLELKKRGLELTLFIRSSSIQLMHFLGPRKIKTQNLGFYKNQTKNKNITCDLLPYIHSPRMISLDHLYCTEYWKNAFKCRQHDLVVKNVREESLFAQGPATISLIATKRSQSKKRERFLFVSIGEGLDIYTRGAIV